MRFFFLNFYLFNCKFTYSLKTSGQITGKRNGINFGGKRYKWGLNKYFRVPLEWKKLDNVYCSLKVRKIKYTFAS